MTFFDKICLVLFNPLVMIILLFVAIFTSIALFNVWGCIAVGILFWYINKKSNVQKV